MRQQLKTDQRLLSIALVVGFLSLASVAIGSGGGTDGNFFGTLFSTLHVLSVDSATAPTGGTLRGGNCLGGTANCNGGTVTIQGGQNTGNGTSSVYFDAYAAGTAGATGPTSALLQIMALNVPANTLSNNTTSNETAGTWRFQGSLIPKLGIAVSGAGSTFATSVTLSAALNMNSGPIAVAAATGLAGAGGFSGVTATVVCNNASFSTITSGAASSTVALPSAPTGGQICDVVNKTANTLALFASTGGNGNGVLCLNNTACFAAGVSGNFNANQHLHCIAEQPGFPPIWSCE